jgi:acetyl-CoA carboxylase biotin carboxylase subunit
MRRALREFVIKGIKTSIPFHRAVLENPRFLSGHFDTSFIETEILKAGAALEQADENEQRVAIMLAAIAAFHRDRELAARAQSHGANGPAASPWKTAGRARGLRGSLR